MPLSQSFNILPPMRLNNVPMIPGTGCHSVIGNQTIHNHHRRRIGTRRGHQRLLQYIREKLQLSEEAVSQIDWDSHTQSIRTLHITSRTFLVKFRHKWLPVGKQIHRYNPSILSSHCPSCQFPVEDFDHTFRCQDPWRRSWQSKLRTDLTKANWICLTPI
jgi:hypothetical protein